MKKLLLSLILINTLIIPSVFAQWIPKASVPISPGNDGAVSFVINDIAYLTGGFSYWTFSYNSTSNTWQQVADLPDTIRRTFGSSFVIDSIAYVLCGGDNGLGGPFLKTMYAFNPATNTWTQKADFPGGERLGVTAFAIDGKGYAGCGLDLSNFIYNDMYRYDPVNDTWTQVNDFAGAERAMASCFIANNKAYLCCGADPSLLGYKDCWEYDHANDTWTQKTDFPGQTRFGATGISNGSRGLIGFGTQNFTTNFNDFYEYNALSDSWSNVSTFPDVGRAWASGFLIGNNYYVTMGLDNNNVFKNDLWMLQVLPSGTNEISISKINAYPNPFTHSFTLSHLEPNHEIEIFNISGQHMNFTQEQNTISINNWSPGIYFISIKNVKNIQTLIIQKN